MGQLESFNPATGELVGTVDTIEPKDVDGIVADIAEVQPFWAQLTPEDRGRYLRRVADELVDDLEGVARLISTEQGKPMAESYVMELIPTIDALHWCADEGPKILRDEPISYPQIFFKTKRSFFSYEPIGVVGVIAPWNYPWSIPFGEVAIALMCGNGVILKPASLTPLLGDRIQAAFERGGVPEGLVRTVHGGGQIGQAICESQRRRQGVLHRLGRGRTQGRRDLREPDEGLGARARRQGPADRLRRRRPGERRVGLRLGRVRERRTDLLGDRAHLRRRLRRRPVPRGRRSRDGAAHRRRPARVDDRDRPDGLRRSGGPGDRPGRRRDQVRRGPAYRRAA